MTGKRQKPPEAPQILGATTLRMLFRLWEAGYENPIRATQKELWSLRELRRMGYAERDPSIRLPGSWRITGDGIDRLIAPMFLWRRVADSKRLRLAAS